MNNTTKTPSPKEVLSGKSWYQVDATGQVLGRLAANIAAKLLGKDKASYVPNLDTGDKVVVINASKLVVTGDKMNKKIYYRHTGFPGGFRSQQLKELWAKDPSDVLRRAVEGMLPKNKLRKVRIGNLYVYNDAQHPHMAHTASKKESK